MTERDPGAPQTDELARNAARHTMADQIEFNPYHRTGHEAAWAAAGAVADSNVATWEHAINEHGQPVRRYVLRGAWEVDPEARRD